MALLYYLSVEEMLNISEIEKVDYYEYLDEINTKNKIINSQSNNTRHSSKLFDDFKNLEIIFKKEITTKDLVTLSNLRSAKAIKEFMAGLKSKWRRAVLDSGRFNTGLNYKT